MSFASNGTGLGDMFNRESNELVGTLPLAWLSWRFVEKTGTDRVRALAKAETGYMTCQAAAIVNRDTLRPQAKVGQRAS